MIKNKVKYISLLIIFLLSIYRLKQEGKFYPTGDAVEYTIMTEAFFNHFSPDVRGSDFDSFKAAYTKSNKWEDNDKFQYYDDVQKYVENNNLKILDYNYAFFVDKEGKKYSCHFFFYSFINLPVKFISSIIGFNPLVIEPITNIILILLTCFFLFKYSLFDEIKTSLFVFLLFFSTNYWYLSWQHPEVFTVCFSTLGLWLFLKKNYYWGMFLISIAALQNQPLSVIVLGLSIFTIFTLGLNIKNVVKVGLSTFIILIPSIFYYLHFGESNLIKYQGALNFDYVTFNRVFGFFFDLNQGVILAIPLILIIYIILIIKRIILFKKEKPFFDVIFIVFLIGGVSIAATIDNWNHGQSVVNRYVTYMSGLILVHFFYLIIKIDNQKLKNVILFLSLVSQIATVLYHNSLSKYDWSTNIPKPISNWVLNNFPSLYNPDPVIFISRYNAKAMGDLNLSPVYYINADGMVTKLLVHEKHVNNLIQFGFSEAQIDSIAPYLSFVNKWAYLDINSQLENIISKSKLKQIDFKRKLANQIMTIKGSSNWYENVKKQAISEGITEEEALRKNAAFVLGINLSEFNDNSLTKEELILNKISQIRADKNWLQLIENKSKEQNISIDSAIYIDAKWIIENEIKK